MTISETATLLWPALLGTAALVAAVGYAWSAILHGDAAIGWMRLEWEDFDGRIEAEIEDALDEIFDDAVEERVAEVVAERAPATVH